MANKYINKFKNKTTGEEYEIFAASANTCVSTQNSEHATLADSANAIGKVEKYSGFYGGKQREGLKIVNSAYNGENPNYSLIEMNSKGNLSIESLAKHVNIEAKSGVQIKPTTNIIFDSSRRILANKGNEVQVEAKFDDYSNYQKGEAPEYDGRDGVDEEYAELKLHSRNVDLRCHKHGGIALQIAGCDNYNNPSAEHHENKIKFESDRKVPLSDNFNPTPSSYHGEGGKGLEFGTFNNEHTSLYTHDYRFRGQGTVFGVLREAPVMIDGKFDYPTQEDDFKDVITNATPNATWNEIIDAANKCKGKEAIASENYVSAQIAAAQLSGSSVDLSAYATTEYVDNAIASSGGGSALQPGNGITISEGYISVNNYSNIEPLTALTKDVDALKSIEYSKKGNLRIENKGDFAFEAMIDTTDEHGDSVVKGDKVVSQNIGFYEAEDAYFYKAKVDTTYFDGTPAPEKSIVLMKDVEGNPNELNYYDNPDYYYKAKYDTVDYHGNPVSGKGVVYKSTMTEPNEEAFYTDKHKYGYKATVASAETEQGIAVDKGYVVDISLIETETYYKNSPDWEKIMTWERVDIWEKNPIWKRNASNLNIESDSKIKLLSDKMEVYFEDSEDTDEPVKNRNIMLGTEELSASVNKVVFERSVSKNGVETGCDRDPIISLVYKNNVKDPTKVPDFAAFKAGWLTKHTLPKTDEELMEIYNRLLTEPDIPNVTVKLSVLLGLVDRVAALEETVMNLTSRIEALEGGE